MSKEPKRNVYVGHRYVPLIIGEWNKEETYEGLSIVTNEGTSYTSKKRVPVGIDILNEDFWVVTGNYNAQVDEYRRDVRDMETRVKDRMDNTETIVKESIEKTENELLLRGINVKNPPYPLLGVKNNGEDETEIINEIIKYASDNGINKVLFPDGLYLVNPGSFTNAPMGDGGGIELLDNITLILNDNAIIKALPSTGQGYNIIRSNRKKNIGVIGGSILGERSEHLGVGGEWGHGINIRGCNGVTIDTTVNDCWGDGVYIGTGGLEFPTRNLNIISLHATNNRRQGISMTHVDGFNIEKLVLKDTNGTNPQAGLDIEPNGNERVVNGFINSIYSSGNVGAGVQIYADRVGALVDNIIIDKIITEDNRSNGLICRRDKIKGVEINTLITKNNDVDGFRVSDGASGVSIKKLVSHGNNRGMSMSNASMVSIDFVELKENNSSTEISSIDGCFIGLFLVDDIDIRSGLRVTGSKKLIIESLKIKESNENGLYVTSTTDSEINVDISNCVLNPIIINNSKRNIFTGKIGSQSFEGNGDISLIKLQNSSTNNSIRDFSINDYIGNKANNAVEMLEGSEDNFIGFNNFKGSYTGLMITGESFNNVGFNFPIPDEVLP